MLTFIFWKVSLKGKAFTLIKVPPIAVMAVAIIIGGAMVVVMAVVAAVMAITPGKGSEKNLKKSSPRRKKGVPLGLPIQKGARVRVIGAPLNTSPA